MNFHYIYLLFSYFIFSGNIALANGIPTFLNNTFVEEHSCVLKKHKNPAFYFINSSGADKEFLKDRPSYLAENMAEITNGSMVFVHPKHHNKVQAYEYAFIQVAKAPNNYSSQIIKNQKGYLYGRSLHTPESWKITILESNSKGFKSEPIHFLNGKTLMVVKEGDNYVSQTCCSEKRCKRYPLFKVFAGHQQVGYISFNPQTAHFIQAFEVENLNFNSDNAIQASTLSLGREIVSTSADKHNITTDDKLKIKTPQVDNNHSENFDNIVCTDNTGLRVWDADLRQTFFTAPQFDRVKIFSGWGQNKKSQIVDGKEYNYIKVQFSNNQVGWVAEDFIKGKDQCDAFAKRDQDTLAKSSKETNNSTNSCCRFPTLHRPRNTSYWQGSTGFGARRKGGRRAHAANDLKRPNGEGVVAVTSGKIIRKYKFLKGTYALEVILDNGLQALYGEVSHRLANGLKAGKTFSKGDALSVVGGLSMLHFELYSGKSTGQPMASRYYNNKYKRRSDLINPKDYLRDWERETFLR